MPDDDVPQRPDRNTRTLAERPDEPPVVARMIVEIRSDGSRTIARGAIEEATTGERVAIEAHGSSPLALATSLAKSMFSAPALARQAVRALLDGAKNARSSERSKRRAGAPTPDSAKEHDDEG
ncbi:MAG: hypothetical protein U0263_14990 [Polyangiaceae bacterium]